MSIEQRIIKHEDDGSNTEMVLVERAEIENLRETIAKRERQVKRLLNTCADLLEAFERYLPKKTRWPHDTELVERARAILGGGE